MGAKRRMLDRTRGLPAEAAILVHEEHGQAVPAGFRCRGHAGRAGTDDHDVIAVAEISERGKAHHVATSLRPRCRVMTIPFRSCTMQLCRFATPSIDTRHSKQMPIRQYGPRAAPEIALSRQCE